MGRTRTVAESTVIAVGPDAVYAAVSDPTRMGNWSPENTGARLRETSGSLSVGSTFVGSNRRGPLRWRTLCTVTAADPGKRFAFTVGAIGATDPVIKMRIASWEFELAPVDGGTKVTQTWWDRRAAGVIADAAWSVFDRLVLSGKTFPTHNRSAMRETLRKLKAELQGQG